MSELKLEEQVFRPPLTLEEVPLPPGYPRSMLDPARKAVQLYEHKAKIEKIVRERLQLNQRAVADQAYRQQVIELIERDAEFFIDYFCWTYDDRIGIDEPLVLYEFQREKLVQPYLRMIETKGRERMTLCKEKSRGVGFTWVEMALRLWKWATADNWSVLIGAVAQLDVDDGGQEATHESLFGKLRYLIEMLPKWLRDEWFANLLEKEEMNKRFLLKHPFKPRNIIVGKQFGGMFGRGHRYSEVFGDEIAHAEAMQNADTSLKQTSNRFCGGSTPLGKHTFHYQLMKGPLKVVRHTMHWCEHPELDIDWYNEQRQHMTDEAIAQELDINYEGSAGNRVLPEVTLATHFVAPPELANVSDRQGRMIQDGTIYADSLPLHVMIDPGISDALAIVWLQPDPYNREWRVVDFAQQMDKAIDWVVPLILGRVPELTYDGKPWPHVYNQVEHAIIKRHDLWHKPQECFGDHYGTTRSMATGQSAYDVLAQYDIEVCPVKIDSDIQAISYLQLWMRHVKVSGHLEHQRNGPPHTHPTFSEVLSQWRYKKRRTESDSLILKPIHDQYCHGGDCMKMYAQTVDLPDPRQLPVESGRVHANRGSVLSLPKTYRPRR